jgi:hypothetical protein
MLSGLEVACGSGLVGAGVGIHGEHRIHFKTTMKLICVSVYRRLCEEQPLTNQTLEGQCWHKKKHYHYVISSLACVSFVSPPFRPIPPS